MRNIFNDPTIEKEFNRKGFVILDMFTKEEFQQLKALYDEIKGVDGTVDTNKNTYELSFFEKDIERKKYKSDKVYAFLKPYIDSALDDYNPILINLFSKEKGKGEVPIHQNWTFVDEDRYSSVSFWVPLQDVNRENGTLEVVPGSHKTISKFRGPSIPWVFDELNDKLVDEYMVPLNLKEGQIAILDDGIIHYSSINKTEAPRKAIQAIVKPSNAELIHCFKLKESPADEIKVMEVPDDYFLDFDMWSEPKIVNPPKSIAYTANKIDELTLLKQCHLNLSV
jgi:ectoine hydroxylase-related dioxygenase (phytanoyl-CoA dioxygenase family)